jgi:RNA polymerase sigma factor (sigma-70 family)
MLRSISSGPLVVLYCNNVLVWNWDEVWPMCFRIAKRMRLKHADAEDVASSVVLKLQQQSHFVKLEDIENHVAYVWTKARWAVLDRVRRVETMQLDDVIDWELQLSRFDEIAQAERAVRDLLIDLDEDDRRLLEQKFFERRTFSDIAKIRGVTPAACAVRCYRLLLKLRESIGLDDNIDS